MSKRVEMVPNRRLGDLCACIVLDDGLDAVPVPKEELGRMIEEILWSRRTVISLREIVEGRPAPEFPKGSKREEL